MRSLSSSMRKKSASSWGGVSFKVLGTGPVVLVLGWGEGRVALRSLRGFMEGVAGGDWDFGHDSCSVLTLPRVLANSSLDPPDWMLALKSALDPLGELQCQEFLRSGLWLCLCFRGMILHQI